MKKASKFGLVYPGEYHGCASGAFAAIAYALDMKADNVFKSMIGLAGGTGDIGLGTCGAMAGAAAAIGLRFGVGPDEMLKLSDEERSKYVHKVYDVVEKVANRFIEEYGSYLCRDIQWKLFGKSFNLRDPERHKEFKELAWPKECSEKVVSKAACWAVEAILEAEKAESES